MERFVITVNCRFISIHEIREIFILGLEAEHIVVNSLEVMYREDIFARTVFGEITTSSKCTVDIEEYIKELATICDDKYPYGK